METPLDSLVTIYKEQYKNEIERKKNLDTAITLPVSLLAFIFTGIFFIVDTKENVVWFNFFKPFLVIPLIITSLVSIFLLYKVYYSSFLDYYDLPVDTLHKNYKSIKNYHKIIKTEEEEIAVQKNLNETLIRWYQDCIRRNGDKNRDRELFLFSANRFIGYTYFLASTLFILFCITKLFY